MEEEEEDDGEEQGRTQELSHIEVPRTSSSNVLLSDCEEILQGLTNAAFCQDENRHRPSLRWSRAMKTSRWMCHRDHPYSQCMSLSSSVENMTFSGTSHRPPRETFVYMNEPLTTAKRSFSDDASLQCSSSSSRGKVDDSANQHRNPNKHGKCLTETVDAKVYHCDSTMFDDRLVQTSVTCGLLL